MISGGVNMKEGKKRVAFVSGAAMGQGAEVARMLAESGYCVGMIDINEGKLNMVAKQIAHSGATVLPLTLDVTNRKDVQTATEKIEKTFGPIWAVACVAGILPTGGFCIESDEYNFKRVMEVNFFGTTNVAIETAKSMVSSGKGGRIVNWSSVNAMVSTPGFSPYAASKAAIEMFTRTLAVELSRNNITVNCIRPGSITTPMMFDMTEDDYQQEAYRIPLGRWGTVKDISSTLRFLLSDEASWITGSIITVDGGALASSGNVSMESILQRINKRKRIAENLN